MEPATVGWHAQGAASAVPDQPPGTAEAVPYESLWTSGRLRVRLPVVRPIFV